MGYNSRTNFAEPDSGELSIEEFMRLLSKAMELGWNNIKQNPPKHQCQWHGDKYISDDNGRCLLPAVIQTAMLNEENQLEPILLCAYHAKKLNKQLGRYYAKGI